MMKNELSANHWDFFDKIYCISLEERGDRREDARIQFSKVGLLDRVEFVVVKRHSHNCEQGIYDSHMSCIKRGIQADAGNIVVFEDDIRFERFDPANLKDCADFLSAKSDWKLLFFGCLVKGSKETQNKSVRKVKFRSLAHAYAINRKFAETLVGKPWQETAFDNMLSSFGEGLYAAYPSFAFQSNSRTDNYSKLSLDKLRRLFGGLRRIQKWNELFYRHKTLFIALHIVVLLFLILAFTIGFLS
ncbi:MAG: glycosyltransferase [Candidatus Omnitrophota bacterium]